MTNMIDTRGDTSASMTESFKALFRDLKAKAQDPSIKTITVMVGIPGAGKSTYAQANPDAGTLFVDTVGARPGFRRAVINIAKEAGKPIIAVYVDTPFDECVRRNDLRAPARRVPQDALVRAAEHLRKAPPLESEGFSKVVRIAAMPLQKTCSIAALESNISSEIKDGRPREQAVAIAFQTLRDACKEADKPVPTRKISKRGRTPEYLSNALDRARKLLNPRDFAVIHQAARASAGGKISGRNRRMRAAERMMIDKASHKEMSKAELRDLERTLNTAYERNEKRGDDNGNVLTQARSLRAELERREMKPNGRVYVALVRKAPKASAREGAQETNKALDAHGCDKATERYVSGQGCVKKSEIAKGFVNGDPEGGMHAHGLDRRNAKTLNDGGHLHLWILPGGGELVLSNEDGFHQHVIEGDGTSTDGAHSHRVLLPSDALVETKLGGEHAHQLMVETSGFDGLHKHTLIMPDGIELESLTPAEFVAELDVSPVSAPLPSASVITRAMLELRVLRDEAAIGAALPGLDEAVEMVAMGKTIDPPTFTLEAWESYPEFGVEPGDLIDVGPDGEVFGLSKHVVPDEPESIEKMALHWELINRHTTQVPFSGPEDAKLLFVVTAPNELELARKRAIVGDDALTFNEIYLDPLGMKRSDVAVGFAMPTLPHQDLNAAVCERWNHQLVAAMKKYNRAKIVSLGSVARDVLKSADVEFWSLPYPYAVRKRGNSGEVGRKLKAIAKALDVALSGVAYSNQREGGPSDGSATGKLADAISKMRKTGRAECRVVKSDGEKQIVYGVVLDPYVVDLQNDWIPPGEIESTAHGFLEKSRVIGFEHLERADATIVESWVEVYPPGEHQAALENRPHRAFKRKFGDDVIHSGSWVAGVKLGDQEWALYKQGKLNAFSVGGFSFKTKVTTAAMPEVEFIELIEAPQ